MPLRVSPMSPSPRTREPWEDVDWECPACDSLCNAGDPICPWCGWFWPAPASPRCRSSLAYPRAVIPIPLALGWV